MNRFFWIWAATWTLATTYLIRDQMTVRGQLTLLDVLRCVVLGMVPLVNLLLAFGCVVDALALLNRVVLWKKL